MPDLPLLLGIDVGTQSLRAGLFDLAGNRRAFAVAPIDTLYPHPTWAEQDANQWWQAARTAIPAALAQAKASADQIAGIGLDCTACTVIPCSKDATPLRPALLWMDQRSFREAEEISATNDPILRWVSGVVSPEWMLPKALWLKRHERKLYDQAERLVECTDWFMYRLTGEWTLSLNNVTVKWNYARPDGGWSEALLKKIDLKELKEKWPRQVVPLGKGEARLSAAAASELCLKAGTPVAQGGIDAYLGMIGLGAVRPGDLAMIMGSSTCHLAMSDRQLLGSGMLGCFPDAISEGTYTLEGGQTATGSIVNWYRQHLAGNEVQEAERKGTSVYELLDAKAAAVPPGCEGLICLDYWQGNRSPLKDPKARGLWCGLTLSHGPGHLFRSIYEGTAFGTRLILEDLTAHGGQVTRIHAGGGGAQSRLWLQIHADVCNVPVHLPRETESCALGSALVAAVHAGHYANLEEAARQMVQLAGPVEPQPKHGTIYNAGYRNYLDAYTGLQPLMHKQAEGQT